MANVSNPSGMTKAAILRSKTATQSFYRQIPYLVSFLPRRHLHGSSSAVEARLSVRQQNFAIRSRPAKHRDDSNAPTAALRGSEPLIAKDRIAYPTKILAAAYFRKLKSPS